jgi:hypothetical protein
VHAYAPRPVRARIVLVALAAWAALLAIGIPLWLKTDRSAAELPVKAAASGVDAYAPVRFTSDEGRFSAEFPSKPVRSEVTSHVADGDIRQVNFSSASDRGVVAIKYRDFIGTLQDADTGRILDAAPATVMKGGTVESTTPTTAYGSPGVDFVVKGADGERLLGRIVLAGTENPRLFTLVAGPMDIEGAKAAYDRLLETFTLEG